MLENVPRSKLDAIIVKETPVNQHDTKSLTKKVVNKARITTKIEVKSALPVVQEIKVLSTMIVLDLITHNLAIY